jgi:hypothetical protein
MDIGILFTSSVTYMYERHTAWLVVDVKVNKYSSHQGSQVWSSS